MAPQPALTRGLSSRPPSPCEEGRAQPPEAQPRLRELGATGAAALTPGAPPETIPGAPARACPSCPHAKVLP